MHPVHCTPAALDPILGRQKQQSPKDNPEALMSLHWLLQQFGRRDWTRTNDPHHVKVVL
jgi:hypothetical protein